MNDEKLKEKYNRLSTALSELIEKMDYKASLLKLESESSWQKFKMATLKLKKRFRENLFEAKETMQEARLQGHLGWMEAKEEWDEFKDQFDDALNVLKGKKKNFDEARLQGHLGKMELKDRFAEKRKTWESNYTSKVEPYLEEGLEKVSKEIKQMNEKLGDEG